MNSTPSEPGLAERFAIIAEGLYHVLAKYIAQDRTAGPMILLACGRLRRRAARFALLVERMRAGILPAAPKPRQRTARPEARGGAPDRPAPVKLPRDHGWTLRWMKHEAALYAFRLSMFMNDPDLPALLAASPQAAGLLRAMWRMLTTDTLPEILKCKPRAAAAPAPPPAALPPPPPAEADAAAIASAADDDAATPAEPSSAVAATPDPASPAAHEACRPADAPGDDEPSMATAVLAAPGDSPGDDAAAAMPAGFPGAVQVAPEPALLTVGAGSDIPGDRGENPTAAPRDPPRRAGPAWRRLRDAAWRWPRDAAWAVRCRFSRA